MRHLFLLSSSCRGRLIQGRRFVEEGNRFRNLNLLRIEHAD